MGSFHFDITFLFCVFISLRILEVQSLPAEKIVGGAETQPNEIKYLVAIYNNGAFTCGGGIIAPKFILTAAHCVVAENDQFRSGTFKIIAGARDLTVDDPNRVEVDVHSIYVPKVYNGSLWLSTFPKGDIAILRLKTKLDLSPASNLQRLQLPSNKRLTQLLKSPYINSESVLAGYGWTKVQTVDTENGPQIVNGVTDLRILKAKVYVFDYLECGNLYQTIYKSNICAKVINFDDDTPQGACNGDSGSPLVYKNPYNVNIVIGVTSGVEPVCDEKYAPAVYTRVSSFIKFIRTVKSGEVRNMRVKIF